MKILKWDFKRQLHPKPLPSNNIQEILVIMTGLKSKTYLIKVHWTWQSNHSSSSVFSVNRKTPELNRQCKY